MATEPTESTDPSSPTLEVVFPPPRKSGGEGKKSFGGAAHVAMASNFRDGGAFFLTGTSFPGNAG